MISIPLTVAADFPGKIAVERVRLAATSAYLPPAVLPDFLPLEASCFVAHLQSDAPTRNVGGVHARSIECDTAFDGKSTRRTTPPDSATRRLFQRNSVNQRSTAAVPTMFVSRWPKSAPRSMGKSTLPAGNWAWQVKLLT